MLRLRQLITITQVSTKTTVRDKTLYFPFLVEAKGNSSFDNQTATNKVTLPRNLKYQDQNIYQGENPLLLRGDKIKIEGGYHPNLRVIFDGYIAQIKDGIPIELDCEDFMWVLKQTTVKAKAWKSINLDDLLAYVIGSTIPYINIGADLGEFRINKEVTVSKILNVLRNEYGLYSRIVNGVLQVGLPFNSDEAVEKTFIFEKQIIENNLNYLRAEDVRIQVKGVLIKEDNSRVEKVYGDLDGDIRTVFQYGGTEKELDRVCKAFLEQANYTGYYGSFVTFLEPAVKVGDYITLDSYKVPDRKGTYLAKAVNPSIGINGGRQEIELERRIR